MGNISCEAKEVNQSEIHQDKKEKISLQINDQKSIKTKKAKKINKSKTGMISHKILNKKDLIKVPFVKDLIVKVDVLKNGVLNERKKTTTLAKKIEELESEIKTKTEQIKNLMQEKNDLEKKLSEKEKENNNKNGSVIN